MTNVYVCGGVIKAKTKQIKMATKKNETRKMNF